ncbi:NUDIX hydrolase [Sphingomonas arenae]|uniref:NUDIX hydrolase n=1 Tax=Sphingomonas arenae TaxID=2812555 RepID=UPI001967CAA1|nr:NUDIX domain-containing protein [Sphingomonas arenae]
MTDDAIPAATLIVMRERGVGTPELLMVTRTRGMAFAGGAMVFPGGRIDAQDQLLGAALPDGAARVAAIRETLEESGLPVALDPMPDPCQALALQSALHAGSPLSGLLNRHGLGLALDQLTPFARWKPAFKQPRKFDTLFYLAEAPGGDWPLVAQAGECEAVEWLTAAAVLDRIAAGTASAIFPTVRNLERLALFSSIAEARAHAAAHPIETVTPWIEEEDGVKWLRIPDHLGYPVTRERLNDGIRA